MTMLNIKERMNITALKLKRKTKGLTQEGLATKSSLLVRTYQRYEKGERTPDVHTSIRIAETLDVPVNQDFKDLFPLPGEAEP